VIKRPAIGRLARHRRTIAVGTARGHGLGHELHVLERIWSGVFPLHSNVCPNRDSRHEAYVMTSGSLGRGIQQAVAARVRPSASNGAVIGVENRNVQKSMSTGTVEVLCATVWIGRCGCD
jgi:hypothetical protein